ncbi:MAG: hypothetical protein ACE5IC_03345 [Candidatus Brocadiales bacterium]
MNAPKKKQIYVIIAFHAHQPVRDIPNKLVTAVSDPELSGVITKVSDIPWYESDGENVYRKLIQFSRSMKIPVTLSATNELLFQVRKFMPETHKALKEAYKNKEIFPLYTFAHHTHMVLIHPDEIIDEIKLNREFLHYIVGAPHPRFRGVFPTEASLDEDKLIGISESKISFVVFPHLDPLRAKYRMEGTGDIKAFPFWIRHGLLAIPRHFSVSQGILKPLMQGNPDLARSLGYPLGDLPVFPEEYVMDKKVPFPIQEEDMTRDYAALLRKALEEAPDRGLMLYMQGLDPMGIGGQALDVLQESWRIVRGEGGVELKFVTPDEYLAEIKPKEISLPTISFNQVTWVPETRPVLRVDGHYPPLGVEDFRGVKVSEQLYSRWPLIFWQQGCFIVEVVETVYETLGIPFDIGTTASKLADEDYDISKFEISTQLALHLRFIKAAHNWGLMPDEDRQKHPYIHLLSMCRKIREKYADVLPLPVRPLPGSLEGMMKSLDIFVQGRVDCFRGGIGTTKQKDPEKIESYLKDAGEKVQEAKGVLEKIVDKEEGQLTTGELIDALGLHARLVVIAMDDLQRAWQQCSNAGAMRDFCYKHFYETFPPKFPKLLEELNRDFQGIR